MATALPKKRYLDRLAVMKRDRSPHEPHWLELEEFLMPTRTRWLSSDRTEGRRRNKSIMKGAAIRAHKVLGAGMNSGITNQAAVWFEPGLVDKELMERDDVRVWLHDVGDAIRRMLDRSNFYHEAPQMYLDASGFGTAVMFADQDPKTLLHCEVLPLGSYYLQSDKTGRATTLYRIFEMTVENMVEMFGLEACSFQVRELYREKKFDEGIEILHVIEPRKDRNPNSRLAKHMPFSSVWMETSNEETKLLRESGYEELPFFAWRWKKLEKDAYGTDCPGMESLGPNKQLQLGTKRQAQLVDKVGAPPVTAPATLRGKQVSLRPGAVNYVDALVLGQKVEPIFKVDPQAIPATGLMNQDMTEDIRESFFVDLFLAMLGEDRSNVTATEVSARREEKMLQLGVVIEGVFFDWLKELIDLCFKRLQRAGELPQPPTDLVGADIEFEMVSILARAQKLLGTVSTEKLLQFVAGLHGLYPEIKHKVNVEAVLESYAQDLGAAPDLLRSDEEYDAILEQMAQAQAQAEAQAQEAQQAETAKTLSDTDLDANSALRALIPAAGGSPGA